jgi:hypothetical protein
VEQWVDRHTLHDAVHVAVREGVVGGESKRHRTAQGVKLGKQDIGDSEVGVIEPFETSSTQSVTPAPSAGAPAPAEIVNTRSSPSEARSSRTISSS